MVVRGGVGELKLGGKKKKSNKLGKLESRIFQKQSIFILRYSRVTKPGYVRVVTNYGPLNLELYCRHAPRACENFIGHCKSGYFEGTKFHRMIKGFIVSFLISLEGPLKIGMEWTKNYSHFFFVLVARRRPDRDGQGWRVHLGPTVQRRDPGHVQA